MKKRLVHWLMQCSIFLLRSGGWAATGIIVGFIVSFFFRPVGRVDTFAFSETMLGVVITGLSIVGAFTIALQWSNLDRRMHDFDTKVKETTEFFDKQAARTRQVAQEVDAQVEKTLDYYTQHYKDNMEYLDGLLKENAKVAIEVNSKIDEYKAFYEEKAGKIQKAQKEFEKMLVDHSSLLKSFVQQLDSQDASTQAPTTPEV